MLRRFTVGRQERGFLFNGPDYVRMLRPGVHWVFGLGRTLQKVSTTGLVLEGADLDVILRDPNVWQDVVVADLRDDERALVWVDGRIHFVLGKGRVVLWKDLREVKVDVVKAEPLRFEHPLLGAILETPDLDVSSVRPVFSRLPWRRAQHRTQSAINYLKTYFWRLRGEGVFAHKSGAVW